MKAGLWRRKIGKYRHCTWPSYFEKKAGVNQATRFPIGQDEVLSRISSISYPRSCKKIKRSDQRKGILSNKEQPLLVFPVPFFFERVRETCNNRKPFLSMAATPEDETDTKTTDTNLRYLAYLARIKLLFVRSSRYLGMYLYRI